MRTVYHISTKGETFHCILNHIMNGIQIGIRTFESGRLLITSVNLERFHPFSFRLYRKIGNAHIPISVMIEFISKAFSIPSTGYINITFTLFVKFSVFSQIITVFHCYFMTYRQCRHIHFKPSGLHPSHIYQPSVFIQLLYRNWL